LRQLWHFTYFDHKLGPFCVYHIKIWLITFLLLDRLSIIKIHSYFLLYGQFGQTESLAHCSIMIFPLHPFSDCLLAGVKLSQCHRPCLISHLRQVPFSDDLTGLREKPVSRFVHLETLLCPAQLTAPWHKIFALFQVLQKITSVAHIK
jgi:hypothetical protein